MRKKGQVLRFILYGLTNIIMSKIVLVKAKANQNGLNYVMK